MSAGPPTRTLTKAEFEQLLQRAAERDVFREPRLFTLPELVAAGQEIGIAPVSVQEVYGEYQQALQQQYRARQQPLGSIVRLHKDGDVLQLVVPPLRVRYLRLKTVAVSAFTSVPAVAVIMMHVNPLLALPWLAVVAGAGYIAHQSWRTPGQELRLRRDGSGLLMRFSGRRVRESHQLIAGQVHARLAAVTETTQQGTETFRFVALDHATHTFPLLEGYSYPEQAWVVDEIERWLGR
jgi:hypothetical protein